MELMTGLEYLGTFFFAFSGATVAMDEKLDYLGVFFLATVTALGGGLMRDAVLSRAEIYAFSHWLPYGLIFLATLAVIIGKYRFHSTLLLTAFDAIGLAAFTSTASHNAILSGQNLLATAFCAFATAAGGGILRDVVVNRKPYVLRKEIYGLLSLLGALFQWCTQSIFNDATTLFSTFLLVFCIRMVCYQKNLNLPIPNNAIVQDA